MKKVLAQSALAVVVGLAALLGGLLATGRYEAHPVLTGSMRPGFAIGSVVVLKRVPVATLSQGDVILFHRPDDPAKLVVHRIYSLTHRSGLMEIRTKGDDNPEPDAWTVTLSGNYAYRAEFTVPFVGYASLWFDRPGVRLDMFLVIVGGVLVYGAVQYLRRPAGTDVAGHPDGSEDGGQDGEAAQELRPHDLELEAGQVGTEAVAGPESERDVRVG